MDNASYIGLSLKIALETELEMIANNVANANTTGFQAQRVMFAEFLAQTQPDETISYVENRAVRLDTGPGPLTATANPLDLAIVGDGYFTVETAEGFRYTRAGAFQLNADGQIVTASGAALMGEGNVPLFIAPGETTITVARDGTVATENGVIGRLGVVAFEDPQGLVHVGDTLFASEETPIPATGIRVAQGMIEGSNVQPILELTRMIEVSRTYQQVQQLIDAEDELGLKAMEALVGQI